MPSSSGRILPMNQKFSSGANFEVGQLPGKKFITLRHYALFLFFLGRGLPAYLARPFGAINVISVETEILPEA